MAFRGKRAYSASCGISLNIMNPADLPSAMISRLYVSVVGTCAEMNRPLCFVVQARNSASGDNNIKTRIAHFDRFALFVYYFVSFESS
jgi:hypothetical protein